MLAEEAHVGGEPHGLLVWPQPGIDFKQLEDWAFDYLMVQPMDGPGAQDARDACIRFVIQHPRWRLSVQSHKLLGLR